MICLKIRDGNKRVEGVEIHGASPFKVCQLDKHNFIFNFISKRSCECCAGSTGGPLMGSQ